ncbi:hypothetical protein JTE90_016844 [Oedothorax gibbosus]|uniref:Acyl-CoA dehydrogenase n=1 Tax=Oedothorax gibbosus TaxID=931172 RepID=A0AAV6VZB8_9ARAC|nr:hypothetical protein JTE90_016844 [Oedothorax gibbosus]
MFSVTCRFNFNHKLKTYYRKTLHSKCPKLPALYFSSEASENSKYVEKQKWVQFSHAQHGNFIQERPSLHNPFISDFPLQRFLNSQVPSEVNNIISSDLTTFGDRIVQEIDDLGWECELNPPRLTTYDAWGQRVDELHTCNAWNKQHDICAEEGIVAIPYENKLDYWSRLHQICKLYLYAPSSGLYSCPIAMTDGAAKSFVEYKKSAKGEQNAHFLKAFNKLTTRNPNEFWTSGQWMTEKRGGSDVAQGTETVAVPEGDFYRLYGYKWFSSATDANMALTLARVVHSDKASKSIDGLTMFYLETRKLDGQLNNIQMVKLKNKLGTRQLPTAELLLDGCIAHKMSEEGRGIASISHMLNITRFHNSVASIGGMRRILLLSRDFSHKRMAFGNALSDTSLHLRTLSKMEIEVRGSLLLVLKAAILLGKIECGVSTSDEALLLRLLSPVMKLYTAKQAVAGASEGLESFGGQGYIEDTRLPCMYRDAQVLPIWEGTTNVMSMDVIRSMTKSNFDALLSFEKSVKLSLEAGKDMDVLKETCQKVDKSLIQILQFVKESMEFLPIAARDIAYSIARTYIGAALIESAAKTKNETDVFAAQQWCKMQELSLLSSYYDYSTFKEKDLKNVMEGYKTL